MNGTVAWVALGAALVSLGIHAYAWVATAAARKWHKNWKNYNNGL